MAPLLMYHFMLRVCPLNHDVWSADVNVQKKHVGAAPAFIDTASTPLVARGSKALAIFSSSL
jgi:hypothetical protein